MGGHDGASCGARDLLKVPSEEGVTRSWIGGESNALSLDAGGVEEPEVTIKEVLVGSQDALILALEHGDVLVKVEGPGSGRSDGAVLEALIALEVLVEDLSVVHEAFSLVACPAVGDWSISVEEVLSQETEHDGSTHVGVLQLHVVSCLEHVEDLHEVGWLSKDVFSLLDTLQEWVDVVPW